MPTPPKVDNACCPVWQIKVQRQVIVKQQTKPYCHFRITGKIEIQLQCIGQRPAPSVKHCQISCTVKNAVSINCQFISNNNFFKQTYGKP